MNTRCLFLGSLLASLLLSISGRARAEEPVVPTDHTVAITLAPLQLLATVVEVTSEVRLHPRVGLGLTLGIGSVPLYGLFHGGDRLLAMKTSLAFNGYVLGHFDHGLQLGGGVAAVKLSGEVRHDVLGNAISPLSASGEGLGFFGHVGYKRTLPVGFTYGARLGLGYLFAHASAADFGARSAMSQQGVYVLGDIQVGWAF